MKRLCIVLILFSFSIPFAFADSRDCLKDKTVFSYFTDDNGNYIDDERGNIYFSVKENGKFLYVLVTAEHDYIFEQGYTGLFEWNRKKKQYIEVLLRQDRDPLIVMPLCETNEVYFSDLMGKVRNSHSK